MLVSHSQGSGNEFLKRGVLMTTKTGVQSLDRVVTLLRCFDARHAYLGVTELARTTGLSTSTVHRLLTSMSGHGLVRQNFDQRYTLGPLIVQLARGGAIPTTLRDTAMPVVKRLRDEIDETVGVHELLPNGNRSVVDQAESRQELRRTYTEFGTPLPLPLGAPGKAILAFLPDERQQWWLSQEIPPATPHTPTPQEIGRELVVIRSRGWAHSDAERTPGIRSVASPVFDHTGVVGAISVSVPVVRMDDERTSLLGSKVVSAAWQISEALGANKQPYPGV